MVTVEVFFVARFSSNGRFFQQNRRISRIVLRAYVTRKLEILRRRRRNGENLKCNRLNKQNKNSESAARFLVHFFAAIALMLTYRIYGNATVASELSEFKESHDCTAFHCTSFLNFAFGISPRIERSDGPEKKRVL